MKSITVSSSNFPGRVEECTIVTGFCESGTRKANEDRGIDRSIPPKGDSTRRVSIYTIAVKGGLSTRYGDMIRGTLLSISGNRQAVSACRLIPKYRSIPSYDCRALMFLV
jgi:hypothetical protein